MVNVQQIAVEIQVLVLAHLHRGIGRLAGHGARRKLELGEQAKRRHRHLGQALGHEVGATGDDILDVRVGGLLPGWRKRCHCKIACRLLR